MSNAKNFLAWLRQWKPPAEVEAEAATEAPSTDPAHAPETRQCPWCLEQRPLSGFETPPLAWALQKKSDPHCYWTCSECYSRDNIYAVGASGEPYIGGWLLDAIPSIPDGWFANVAAFPAGQLFGQGPGKES